MPFEQTEENLLAGRNAVREALKAGSQIDKLLIHEGEASGSLREILSMARERKIIIQIADKRKLDALAPNHQGVIAIVPAFAYGTVQDILKKAEDAGEPPFLVLLDGITDPHNLGAILRSCEVLGAHGVVIPERRSVTLTAAAVKAAAGATAWVPVAKVKNLARTVDELKEKGIWVYAADMGGAPLQRADLKGPLAFVIGSEGEGVSRLIKERCDGVLSVPQRGHVDSLNASVAAGILLYEAAKQRWC